MCMISVFGFGMILFNKNLKERKEYNIIIFLLTSLLASLVFTYFDGILKTILLIVVFGLVYYLVFKKSKSKSIFTALLYVILDIFPDLIILNSAIYIFSVSKEYYYNSFAGGIFANLLISIVFLIITYIFRKPLRKIVDYDISASKKIIFVSITTLITLGIFFYNLINVFENNNNIIAYLVVIFTLIVVLFYLFKQKIDNDAISKKYDDLLSVMKQYEIDIEEQRTRVHETRNELMTIKSKITDKEKESEIVKYIDSVLGDKVSSSMSRFSKFAYLPSNGLKGFFYYKFLEAERKELKVSINVAKKIENCFLKDLDTKNFKALVRIIGVYLDNAIEASSNSKNKKLGIEFYYINDKAKLIISNTFEDSVNLDKVGKEVYSTKGKTRGHGLMLVKRILKEYNIFKASTSTENGLYIQELIIENPNK